MVDSSDISPEKQALLERGRYQIETFLLRFGDSYQSLLGYAAIPVVITPELLHYLRVEFTPHLPWVAEVDLLLSDLFRVVGYEQYAMQNYVRAVLLEDLDTQLGRGKIERAAGLLLGYVAHLRQENPYLSNRELNRQRWSAMVFIDDRKAEVAAELSQEFEQSLEKGKSQQDLLGLVAITEQLLPQLQEFPQLIKNAQAVGKILRDRNLSPAEMEASIARQLQPTTDRQSLKRFTEEFEFVTVTFINLRTFSYEVGTLEVVKSRNLLGQERKKFEVKKQIQQGQQFIEHLPDNVELRMVLIPAGSFEMGAPEEEAESLGRERPQHEVRVPAFLMGKYPITQSQWRVVAAMPQIERKLEPEPSSFKVTNHPVENVSWLEAMEFCARLSEYTKREYRLPSEAEWEYGCRAGTVTPFHYGETITTELVNYDGNNPYGEAPKGEDRNKTTPVGKFPANSFGLYDMHGNVWEWCEDDWHDSYEGAPTDGRAWIDNNDSRSQEDRIKLLRGGSWFFGAGNCRSVYRSNNEARGQYNFSFGFRVVCRLQ